VEVLNFDLFRSPPKKRIKSRGKAARKKKSPVVIPKWLKLAALRWKAKTRPKKNIIDRQALVFSIKNIMKTRLLNLATTDILTASVPAEANMRTSFSPKKNHAPTIIRFYNSTQFSPRNNQFF
jgi:hypothetical protein